MPASIIRKTDTPTLDLRLAVLPPAERDRALARVTELERIEQNRKEQESYERIEEEARRNRPLQLGQFEAGAFVFFQGEKRDQALDGLARARWWRGSRWG